MSNTNITFEKLLKIQDSFSKNFYNKDTMTLKEKEEMLKTLCLALHFETSEIVSSSNFKVFDKTEYTVDKNKILYNNIDVFRYILAITNLYDISGNDFISAFEERDTHLNILQKIKMPKKDQKVVVVDIDDVVCSFRSYFNSWLEKTLNIEIAENSKSYYSSKEVKNQGYSPEGVFEDFMSAGEILNIPVINSMKSFLHYLKNNDYYIQMLTARPEENLKCKYQTYVWLQKNCIPFDNVAFASEKYIWVSKQDFYVNNQLCFAIDDSPKHALEYATHDVKVLVPKMPYNEDIAHTNIYHFDISSIKETVNLKTIL